MEKTQLEFDLDDDWEYLPDTLEDSDKKKKIISSSKLGVGGGTTNYSTTVFNMEYFMCPSPPPLPISDQIVEQKSPSSSPVRFHNKVVSVPIQLEPRFFNRTPDDEIGKDLIFMSENNKMVDKDPTFVYESNQDSVSQVFFKKMEENKFVDMKMDSPRSPTSRNIMMPQIEAFNSDGNKSAAIDDEKNGFDLWKWSLTGIGAICSFGVAAATICIIIFGNNKHHQKQQKLRFQIYSDDKRIKQVVHRATKLNEAISAVRGVPITRAHITYGGYYDSL